MPGGGAITHNWRARPTNEWNFFARELAGSIFIRFGRSAGARRPNRQPPTHATQEQGRWPIGRIPGATSGAQGRPGRAARGRQFN